MTSTVLNATGGRDPPARTDGGCAQFPPGVPYDGHTLGGQIKQATTLLQDIGVRPKVAVVELGFRGVDHTVPVTPQT